MKVVITGGPGSGKSTLIKELKARHYPVVEESALIVMGFIASLISWAKQKKWKNSLNDGQKVWFQNQIYKITDIQYEIIEEINKTEFTVKDQVVFYDRGIHDFLAYYPESELKRVEKRIRESSITYDHIFVLETPPPKYFKPGEGRTTPSQQNSAEKGSELYKIYNSYFPEKVKYLPWRSDRVAEIFAILGDVPRKLPEVKKSPYFFNLLVAIDQFGNALCGGNPDNTISARVGYFASTTKDATKYYWKAMEKIINFTFWPVDGEGHCLKAYKADRDEAYNDSGSDFFRVVLSIIIAGPCVLISFILYVLYPILKLGRNNQNNR